MLWRQQIHTYQMFSLFMQPAAAAAAKSLQSCPTLCDPIDGGPPGFPVPGILQARTLEWVAISFSISEVIAISPSDLDSSLCFIQSSISHDVLSMYFFLGSRITADGDCSRVRLCATPQTAAHQAPPSLGSSRPEHWSGLPFPPPMHESEKGKRSRSVVSDSQ